MVINSKFKFKNTLLIPKEKINSSACLFCHKYLSTGPSSMEAGTIDSKQPDETRPDTRELSSMEHLTLIGRPNSNHSRAEVTCFTV